MPIASKLLIAVNNVSYNVDGKKLLSNISFTISRGEYVGIIGPNGGGKTTLLRLMLGLITPTKGTIKQSVSAENIGYVPQRAMSGDVNFPALVEEIIESGIVKKVSRQEKSCLVAEAMKMTNIAHLAERRVGVLSGGERQRVMIARALAGQPEMLFLDEPTAAIDTENQEDFYAFLRDLHKNRGLTIVMVSHDTDALAHEVQRILCLNRHLVCHGHPKDVLNRAQVEHYDH